MERTTIEQLQGLLEALAMEIATAQPGSDQGQFPILDLFGNLRDASAGEPALASFHAVADGAASGMIPIVESGKPFTAAHVDWLLQQLAGLKTSFEGKPPRAEAMPPPQPAPASPGREKGAHAEAPAEIPLVIRPDLDRALVREFINESYEHLENIERGALVLEEKPDDRDTLDTIFRAFHTFKGGAGLLGFTPINQLAHELESLLDMVRQKKLPATSEVIEMVLTGGDMLKQFIIETGLQIGGQKPFAPCTIPTGELKGRIRELMETAVSAEGGARTAGEEAGAVAEPPPEGQSEAAHPAATAPGTVGAGALVRVDLQKLDTLLDQVGELVIAQSQIALDPTVRDIHSPQLSRAMTQLARITKELHRSTLGMRMAPIRPVFQKMSRQVRDVAARVGKRIDLMVQGEDTELDRNLVEGIHDPLIHMIRNSVDHGIEKPDARIARGKSTTGKISLRAFHQGGNVMIVVQDDGAGLNKERIHAKAVERGLVAAGTDLTDREIFQFIFEPGFSTADKVTDISGRGVGMDVVRYNIEKLRGSISVESVLGHGATFTISLPLTLAIIEGLIVHVGARQFVLPTLSVRESFRPVPGMISTLHERGEVINVRGQLIPLLRLYEYLNIRPAATDPLQALAVVLEAGRDVRCMMVDGLLGKQEVVIKNLGEVFRQNPFLAGAAILGDGRIGLILDVNALVQLRTTAIEKAA